MPFALAIIGIVLLITAIRGTTGEFFTLVKGDFSGSDNFIFWVISILIIGGIGYIKKLQPVSDMFLVLVIVVMFLKKGTGFFDSFMNQVRNPTPVAGTSLSSTVSDAAGPGVISNLINYKKKESTTTNNGAGGPASLGDLFGSNNWGDLAGTWSNFSQLFSGASE